MMFFLMLNLILKTNGEVNSKCKSFQFLKTAEAKKLQTLKSL